LRRQAVDDLERQIADLTARLAATTAEKEHYKAERDALAEVVGRQHAELQLYRGQRQGQPQQNPVGSRLLNCTNTRRFGCQQIPCASAQAMVVVRNNGHIQPWLQHGDKCGVVMSSVSTVQAAVELERDAAAKLAYFLNLLRPHLPPEDRFTAELCRCVTVSVVAAVHVVRCPGKPSAAAYEWTEGTTSMRNGASDCLQTLLLHSCLLCAHS